MFYFSTVSERKYRTDYVETSWFNIFVFILHYINVKKPIWPKRLKPNWPPGHISTRRETLSYFPQ